MLCEHRTAAQLKETSERATSLDSELEKLVVTLCNPALIIVSTSHTQSEAISREGCRRESQSDEAGDGQTTCGYSETSLGSRAAV